MSKKGILMEESIRYRNDKNGKTKEEK